MKARDTAQFAAGGKPGKLAAPTAERAPVSELHPSRRAQKAEFQELCATSTEDAASLATSSIVKSSEPSLRKVEGYLVRKLTTVSMANAHQFPGKDRNSSTDSEIRVQDETCSDARLKKDGEAVAKDASPRRDPEADLQTPSQ